jgi:DNA polymerase III subunit epsilon
MPRVVAHPRPLGPPRASSPPTFTAIDFETATRAADSACAVALVRVEAGVIVAREVRLVRPPSRHFEFTYLHGIAWRHVARAPVFGDVWAELQHLCAGVEFLAAHNAAFDERVLRACCARAGLPMPRARFSCTVALARRTWRIFPTRLDCVAARLGIALQHHDAMSDASACAEIVLRAHASRENATPPKSAIREEWGPTKHRNVRT